METTTSARLGYEEPSFELILAEDETESPGWFVVIGGAAVAYFVWRCYQVGGRPTVGRWGWAFYVSCR